MAIASFIGAPFIRKEHGSNEPAVQKDAVPENGTTQVWLQDALVYTSGTGASTVLNELATAGTVIYGQSPDAAKGTGDLNPPNALFGANHFCFDLEDRILEMNIASSTAGIGTIGTVNGVTWAGGGTNGVALAPGQQYGVINPTTGPYKGKQMVDVNNTTQKLFTIVALAPNQATTDNNPRVYVKVIPTVIQG